MIILLQFRIFFAWVYFVVTIASQEHYSLGLSLNVFTELTEFGDKIIGRTCFCKVSTSLVDISGARFIRTVCMRRIWWSCEGLMSVHNEYARYTLKHLLLRHMYNLSLPKLRATLLVGPLSLTNAGWLTFPLCCAVPYMAACVDISRTVFWDRSLVSGIFQRGQFWLT